MNANIFPPARLWRVAAAAFGLMLALPAAAQQDSMQGMDMSSMPGMQMPAPKPKGSKTHKKHPAAPGPASSAHGMQGMGMQHADMPMPMPMHSSTPVNIQHLHFGNMTGARPRPDGLAGSSHDTEVPSMEGMGMSSVHGGKAPPDARSPDYSDGYRYTSMPGMEMADHAKVGMVLIDQLEYAHDNHGNDATFLDGEAWHGEDFNKLWVKAEGEGARGRLEDLRTEALWSHAISTYWDTQFGVRQDFGEGPRRTWAAFGVEGLAPYWFDTEAEVYLGRDGRTSARVQLEYEELITQRLVLQPKIEANFYGKDDPQRGIGSGLSDSELGVRLRYDIEREFGPYIGVVWRERYGRTAGLARARGDHAGELQLSAGVHLWF